MKININDNVSRIFISFLSIILIFSFLFVCSCSSSSDENDFDDTSPEDNTGDTESDGDRNDDDIIVGSIKKDNTIVLSSNLRPRTYTLKYENENGVMKEYTEICTIPAASADKSYKEFIKQNFFPLEASCIGVYDSYGVKVGIIPIEKDLTSELGKKLYSFAALSDVHMQKEGAKADFEKVLTYLKNDSDVDFICICGDMTNTGSAEELSEYRDFVKQYYPDSPVYAITGNHENVVSDMNYYSTIPYTGRPLYYTIEKGNDLFIMLGISGGSKGNLFSAGQLSWLNQTLQDNKDKRCFVFQHVRPNDTSGNADGQYTVDIWGTQEASIFENILAAYPNVFFFHGHSHQQFASQNIADNGIYDYSDGYHSFHIPSATDPRYGTDNGEGYIIEVYENGVLLRGRDFTDNKYVSLAQYYIDTSK